MTTQPTTQPAPTSVPFPSVDHQMAVLMRGVDFGDEQTTENMEKELRKRLEECQRTGTPLRVYAGFDPTATDLHLGHTVPIRKLRQFQELGHTVIFLIGTFTGTIGDPSDKTSARAQQSLDEALEKAKSFTDQAWKVLDPAKTIVDYNHKWLSTLTFTDVIDLASNFTVQQFLVRDNFSKRFEKGDAIWLHEFFYALMQGFDAVELNTDVQIGGTDQLFNLMAGRKLMEAKGMRPQTVLTFPILVGTDGVLRMSKSTGNYIGINESPGVIFTKVLNLADDTIRNFADLVTRWSPEKIDGLMADLAAGTLPARKMKQDLAWEIVSIFHGDAAADQAAQDALRMFQGEAPSDAPTFTLAGPTLLLDVMADSGLVKSKSEARRMVQQGGVRLNEETIEDTGATVNPSGGEQVLQVGKRKFLRILG